MGSITQTNKMDADQAMQEQANRMANTEVPKAPLVKKDNQHWDSADHHAIEKSTDEKENIDNGMDEMERQAQLAMKSSKYKRPLIKKDKAHWDSGTQHCIKQSE